MRRSRKGDLHSDNIFAGFVDVMSNMLILMIFMLFIFIIAQFFVNKTQKDITTPKQIQKLQNEFSKIRITLKKKEKELISLEDSLELEQAETQREAKKYNIVRYSLEKQTSSNKQLDARVTELNAMILELNQEIIKKENTIRAKAKNEDNLKKSVNGLKTELQKLNDVFETTDKFIKWQKIQVVELGKKLNRALANKTAQLYKVRSDFFEQVGLAIKDNKNIRIIGDRFIIQSELFFKSGSHTIENKGKEKLNEIAKIIKTISKKIPKDTNWILRVDGHTDNRPTTKYSSNWELSSKRSISVIKFLISKGIPAKRLAATGFGEHHPIADNTSNLERSINRRIEFKLTER